MEATNPEFELDISKYARTEDRVRVCIVHSIPFPSHLSISDRIVVQFWHSHATYALLQYPAYEVHV
jgi:hypothetical protein